MQNYLLENIDAEVLEQFQAAGKDFIEGGYDMAFNHYGKGQHKEAYDLFVILAALKPADKRMWMGLGACCQMMKNYAEAVEAYSVSAHLDEKLEDPYPHFHAAECFYTMGDVKNAWKALESARMIAHKMGREPLQKRISLLREIWYPKAKALAKKKG